MSNFDTIFFTIFIFIIPIFGKSLDSIESIIFYLIPIIFSILLLQSKSLFNLSKKSILLQILFIWLLLINVIFSRNIGLSYYQFFVIIGSILITNIAIQTISPKNFLKFLIIFSFIYSFIFLFDKVGVIHLASKDAGDNFIKQFWGHSFLSDILLISIPLLIYYQVHPIFIIFQIGVLILTNSRSSLLTLPIIIFLIPNLKHTKKIFFILIPLIAFIIFGFLTNFKIINSKDIVGNRFNYWQQAIQGFIFKPLIGNGLATFPIISEQLNQTGEYSSLTHSFPLSVLCENGILIFLFIFLFIIKRFIYIFHHNKLFFILSLSIFINSLFDTTLNSISLLIFFSYFLFYDHEKTNTNQSLYKGFIIYLVLLTTFHLFSRSISDYFFYIKNNNEKSIQFDPFNINPYLKIINFYDPKTSIWKKTYQQSQFLFQDNYLISQAVISRQTLTDNEYEYFHQLYLQPYISLHQIYEMINHFYETKQTDKTNYTLDKLFKLYNQDITHQEKYHSLKTSYITYLQARSLWETDNNKSIYYLEKAVIFSKEYSFFHIEYANALAITGQKEKSLQVLGQCQQLKFPAADCKKIETNIKNGIITSPFSREQIYYATTQINAQ